MTLAATRIDWGDVPTWFGLFGVAIAVVSYLRDNRLRRREFDREFLTDVDRVRVNWTADGVVVDNGGTRTCYDLSIVLLFPENRPPVTFDVKRLATDEQRVIRGPEIASLTQEEFLTMVEWNADFRTPDGRNVRLSSTETPRVIEPSPEGHRSPR